MALTHLIKPSFTGTALVILALSSEAGLTPVDMDGDFSNGHEGVYDDVLDITWLADAKVQSNLNWAGADAYIDNLNADSYLGVTAWRQPMVIPLDGNDFNTSITYDGSSDFGYQLTAPVDLTYNPNGKSPDFTGSELAYHYYNNFGAIGQCSGEGTTSNNCVASNVDGIDNAPDPEENKQWFNNINDTNNQYWTGVEQPGSEAFYFDAKIGYQESKTIGGPGVVWPVVDGMVGTPITSENIPLLPYWAFIVLGVALTGIGYRFAQK